MIPFLLRQAAEPVHKRYSWLLVSCGVLLCSCGDSSAPFEDLDIRLNTAFEGASLGWHTQIGPREFYISIRHDTESGYQRWYSFRIEGAAGHELTFRVTNANETSSDSAWAWDRPAVSTDGGDTWRRIEDTEYEGPDGRFFSFRYTPSTASDWVAYAPVYNFSRWLDVVEELRGTPFLDTLEVIAETVERRPVHLLKVTDPSVPDSTKTSVWIVGRQHAGDAGASWIVEGLLRWLLASGADAEHLARNCSVYLVPFMNPDGVMHGNYLANAVGMNLNRQWHAPDPDSVPPVYATTALMRDYFDGGGSAELFVDVHTRAVSRANFIFYNGADVTSPEMEAEILRFAETLNRINPDITSEGSMSWPGDSTIASRWASDVFGVHGIVFEGSFQDVQHGPFQGEYMTIERYMLLGEALGQAISEFFFN